MQTGLHFIAIDSLGAQLMLSSQVMSQSHTDYSYQDEARVLLKSIKMIYQDAARPSQEARDAIKSKGAGGTIKKRICYLLKLKLPKLPDLGKLQAHAICPFLICLPYYHLETKMTNSLTHTA